MAMSGSVWRLLLIGLVFHLVYIGTVFDCYFTSPVVHGMFRHSLPSGEAKRLVLIVGDGLRADLLFAKNGFHMVPGAPEVVAPHLRSIVQERGAFGISHTRVPTESRPGHVALIGGMYEDVSAVTKGWKTNPVDFDSVFNQSSATFSFGSPDILPMFARGATPGKVEMWCYDEEEEDFTKDATALDVWVLNQLRALFHNATTDPTLDHRLRGEQTVFFLHLLGLDTTGHSYRPHSKEYMANIQVVDEIVKQTEALFSEFYADEETAFIFTADHGMSKIGNHGDGDPDNTRTPIIAWGKGVRGPLPDSTPSSHDAYSEPFDLSGVLRQDMNQADVAALMSALVGVKWPINSVGVLPDVDPTKPGYLSSREGEKWQAEAALVNARVILEHYRVKHWEKMTHSQRYRPYTYFALLGDDQWLHGESIVSSIVELIQQRRYHQARLQTKDLIEHTLEGLRYLHTYDRTLIRGIVITAYLGWIAYCATSILLPPPERTDWSLRGCAIFSFALLVSFLAKRNSPASFYVYLPFPCYFWDHAVMRAIVPFGEYFIVGKPGTARRYLTRAVMVVAALQSMVAGYTHRPIWSAWFVGIGVVWPLVSWPRAVRNQNPLLWLSWTACCLCTAVFPLLSVHQEENLFGITCGALAMYAVGLVGLFYIKLPNPNAQTLFKTSTFILLNNLGWSLILVIAIVWDLRDKKGVAPVFRIIGWALFLSTAALPFVLRPGNSASPYARLLSFFLGFGAAFVWLAIAVEGMFYVLYTLTLVLWVEVEAAIRSSAPPTEWRNVRVRVVEEREKKAAGAVETYQPRADDLRIAVFFLFFVQVGFFGTGNVASISSFYLEPVYRLVPVFDPFLMAALLIFKIVAPYIILAITFAMLNARLRLPPFSLFLVALALTDVMTITFFLRVTDTGSWLEIGQTISFFCIASLLLVWSAGICALGELLVPRPVPAPAPAPVSTPVAAGASSDSTSSPARVATQTM